MSGSRNDDLIKKGWPFNIDIKNIFFHPECKWFFEGSGGSEIECVQERVEHILDIRANYIGTGKRHWPKIQSRS